MIVVIFYNTLLIIMLVYAKNCIFVHMTDQIFLVTFKDPRLPKVEVLVSSVLVTAILQSSETVLSL